MKVIKVEQPKRDNTKEAALTAYMNTRKEVTFDDIRANVAGFSKAKDATIHEIAENAGFKVELS